MTWFDWEFDDKKGTKFPIKITAYEEVEEKLKEEVTPQNIDKWTAGKNIEITEDELPFY